jgi:hypothetical protein
MRLLKRCQIYGFFKNYSFLNICHMMSSVDKKDDLRWGIDAFSIFFVCIKQIVDYDRINDAYFNAVPPLY